MSKLNDAMKLLAAQPGAFFLGQGVAADGVATFDSLDGIPMKQRLELPVVEELQLGMGIGMALTGYLPILVYPRIDFLLRAMDQLINHLDKLREMSLGQFDPKVIIRTRVGARTPLNAGPQHTQNHTAAFRIMLTHVSVYEITSVSQIMPTYLLAVGVPGPVMVVENIQS